MLTWFPGDPLPESLDGDRPPTVNLKGKTMTEHVERRAPEILPGGKLVRFIKNANPYNAGEVAGFNEVSANHIINVLKVGEAVTYDQKSGLYLSAAEAAPVPAAPKTPAAPNKSDPGTGITDEQYADIDGTYNFNELKDLAAEKGVDIPKDVKKKDQLIKFLFVKGVFDNGGSDTGSSEDNETGTGDAEGSQGTGDGENA